MNLPSYPHSRPLLLEDKPLLDRLFAELQPRVSELTFANLYLFRRAHAYSVSRLGETTLIGGQSYGGDHYYLPPLAGDVAGALRRLLEDGESIYGLDDLFLAQNPLPPGAELLEDRDNADYLYLKSDMAELPGNRFRKKRNRIAYFANRHPYTMEIFTPLHRAAALLLLDRWQQVRSEQQSSSLNLEVDATREGVEKASELGLQGVVLLVKGEVKGFALGERLNDTTCVCHFEKGDPFLEGGSQLVDREFNRLLFPECRLVNREQDLGEPGLRGAKLSYHPLELVRKYRVRLVGYKEKVFPG